MLLNYRKVSEKLFIFIGILLCSLQISLILILIFFSPSNRVISCWKQPNTLRYNEIPYYLLVVEKSRSISTFPISREYSIFIGREDTENYGYSMIYSFSDSDENIEEYIKKSSVEWTHEGVILKDLSGQSLFIPKQIFISGR